MLEQSAMARQVKRRF